jgi:putative CocE/NonD family hydrolase
MSFIHRMMLKRFGLVQTHPVSIQRDLKVRMPDGAELATDVYIASARAPVILIRLPYGKGALLAAGTAYPLASQGFNVVIQCCRGTFGSSGKFDPFRDDERDGLATIEWIKQQPWYGGSIGMYGSSYLGYTQWAVSASAGPEVKALSMQVTLSDFSEMIYSGDSLMLETKLTWTRLVTLSKKSRLAILRVVIPGLRQLLAIKDHHWRTLPLASMDEKVIGERVPFWQDWMEHSSKDDPWWRPMNFRKSIDQVKRPVTMVAGWYDIFVPWQMRDFAALRQAGCEARITVGPWGHTSTDLGAAAMHDAVEWFNRHLRGKDPEPRQRVKLFVIGANEWRYFDEWPPRESIAEQWYLQPQRKLLDRTAPDSAADQYVYDPADPTPSSGGPMLSPDAFSVDNTKLEARSDVLTYTSEPFAEQRDIIGPVAAELYVSSTVASADFFVRLCDVDAAGVSKNICDGLQRIKITSAGTPQRVRIETWPTAYRIAQGHRLRAQISSGAFPRWARNLGGSEPFTRATQLHKATQSIYHSPTCPSAVIVPFCRAVQR